MVDVQMSMNGALGYTPVMQCSGIGSLIYVRTPAPLGLCRLVLETAALGVWKQEEHYIRKWIHTFSGMQITLDVELERCMRGTSGLGYLTS